MVWPVLPPKDQLVRCLLFACMVGSMPAPAQSQSNPDLLSLSIEQLAKTKVYSASRHVEDSRQAPSAVSIITAEDIRRYGWRTLGDALRSLRGFYTSYDRQYTYLGVRGFLRPGDYNSRILLLVNGHRLNDNVYDSAPIGTEFPLDLGIVDRIEIVRGPSSSLFGTNAVFGVINVITRQGASGLSLEASGDVGSFMERSGRLTTSFRHGRVSGLLSGSVYRNAGHSRLYFPEFDSPETNHGIAVDVDGDRSGEAFSDLQLGRVRVQGLFSSRTKVMPTGAYQAIFNDPANMVTDARAYVDVSYHRITSLGDFDLRTYYDRYEYLGSGAFARPNPADRTLARSWAGARWVGAEATLERQIGHHRIVAGGDYEYNLSVEQKNVIIGQPPFFDDRRQPSRAAGYGELELYPGSKLSVRLGARLDWFDIYGKSLSPRVALVYSPNYRTSLKYIYGQAFRAPNAYESYFADGIVIVAPGSPLKPETMRSHELIYDRGLTSWLRITVDASYNHLHDLIDQVPDPATGLTHFVNVGRDRGRAIETELEAKRPSGLSVRASYTLADTTDDLQHIRLANSPLHMAKANGNIPILRHSFAGLELLYTSAQASYQQTRVPSSLLTNLTWSTRPLWGGWEFSASCYNVFNKAWFSPSGPELLQPQIAQDGRTFRFKLSYSWHYERGSK